MNLGNKQDMRKQSAILFIINFFVIGAFFSTLIHPHYATDTYYNLYEKYDTVALDVGRYTFYLLIRFFQIIGFPFERHLPFFMFVSVVLLSLSSVVLFQLCDVGKVPLICKIGTDAAVIICFANVFSTELYLFPECAACYALGIFLTVCAVSLMFREKVSYYILSYIALVAALGIYQVNIAVYVVTFLGIAWVRNALKRGFLAFGIGIAGAASLTNILLHSLLVHLKVAQATVRDAEFSLQTVLRNLHIIISDKTQGQVQIFFNGADLLPRYCLLIVVAVLVVFLLVLVYLKSKKIMSVVTAFMLLLVMYVSVYAPHLVAGEVWLSPRSIYSMFFFVGVLAVMVFHISQEHMTSSKILIVVVLAFFAIDFWSVQGIIVNHFATNKIDQDYAYDIYREIERYENESGETVQYIAAENDEVPLWKNHFVDYYSFNVNERAFMYEWSDLHLVDFVSGRYFTWTEMDEDIYQERFAGKDWDYYCPEEQLYFEGDTLYWCKY